MSRILPIILSLLLLAMLLPGCSVERNNPLSKTYHNITARYNGYFLGKQKLLEVEGKIRDHYTDDYNRVLPIFPPRDTAFISSLKPDFEDIIKKASIPIQRHKNSRWVDDSYVLIGQVRYYQGDFDDAIRTFKYVNLTSDDDNAKHEALVWLMRTFIETHDHEEAVQVSDYLNKLDLNADNYREHFLTRAHFLTLTGAAPQRVIDNLNRALPFVEERDAYARLNFIMAQLHQNLGQEAEAYGHYAAVLRKTPPYDLGFNSKLSMGQVSPVNSPKERTKMDRYFRKLLKDPKNREFQDKIYYEMARFELKQQRYTPALENLEKSVRVSENNLAQQAYSYLLAGQIYFDNLQKYRPAQVYYDSALLVYPQDALDYAAVADRRDLLSEFVTEITTVELEDSLQALAKLDTASLNRKIAQIIAQQEADQLRAKKLQEAKLARQNRGRNRGSNLNANTLTASLDNNAGAGATWYFDNPSAVASAKSEFVRKWGDRALQDNWRRVNQRTAQLADGADPGAAGGADLAAAAAPAEPAPDPKAQRQAQAQQYLANIPSTPEALAASDKKIEEALYKLGNIYQHRLKEPGKAIETYQRLLNQFPRHANKAEVSYSLYLLHTQANDGQQGQYAAILRQEFPDSRFAKLLDDPNYEKISSADRQLVVQLYDSAYTLYETEQYPAALALAESLTERFPENDLADKVAFLRALLIGRTQPPGAYKVALTLFVQDFPASQLQEWAQQLLASYEEFEQGKLTSYTPEPRRARQLLEEEEAKEALAAQTQLAAAPEPDENPIRKALARKKVTAPAKVPPRNRAPVSEATPNGNEPAAPAAEGVVAAPAAQQAEQSNTPATEATGTDATASLKTPATNAPASPPAQAAAPEPAPQPVAPASPYSFSEARANHLFLVVYPVSDPAFGRIKEQFADHNNRYHKSKRLEIEEAPYKDSLALLVLKGFVDGKTANAYANMQKTKSSPLSKVEGVPYQTLVISAENLPLFLERKNVEEYETFYQYYYTK